MEPKKESPISSLGREHYNNNYYDPDIAHPNAEYDDDIEIQCPPQTSEKRLLAKIDLRVIPFLSIMYLLAFLDRTNIANASVFGLQKDLGLTGTQYNTALTIFFVPYVVFEIPSNILLKKLRPHVWLSACMFLFGLVTVCQGLVQGYSGLLTTRFFLGLAETGMFPGSFYLIGMWYKRSEAQRRYSFFFSSTSLAGGRFIGSIFFLSSVFVILIRNVLGVLRDFSAYPRMEKLTPISPIAFGGLLASAIGKMNGMRGYLGWRWIFILEGTLTCVVACFFFFLIPSFPEDAKWLGEDERAYVKARLRKDQGRSAADRAISAKDAVNVFKDFKIFLGGFMYFGLIVPAYGYAFFAPGIIRSYGYTQIGTQLHSVPPWACAFAFAMIVATFSDLLKHRFAFTLIPICVSITGFGILITVHNRPNLEYAALFLVAMGTYSAMPVIVCWFNMNLGGHHRRSVGSAWQIGFGNIGGIIATYAFLTKDAPEYKPGYSICIAFICLSAASCIAYFISISVQNRNRDRAGTDLGLTEYEKTEKGDLSPEYRYLL